MNEAIGHLRPLGFLAMAGVIVSILPLLVRASSRPRTPAQKYSAGVSVFFSFSSRLGIHLPVIMSL